MTRRHAKRIAKAVETLRELHRAMGLPEKDWTDPPPPHPDVLAYLERQMLFWAGKLVNDSPDPPDRRYVVIAIETYEHLLSLYEEALDTEFAKAELARKRKTPPKAEPEPSPKEDPIRRRMVPPLLNPCREFPHDKWSVN